MEEDKYLIDNVDNDNRMLTQTQTSHEGKSVIENHNQSTGSANLNQSKDSAKSGDKNQSNMSDNKTDDNDTTADPEDLDGAKDKSDITECAIAGGSKDEADKSNVKAAEESKSKPSESNIDFTSNDNTDAMLLQMGTQNDVVCNDNQAAVSRPETPKPVASSVKDSRATLEAQPSPVLSKSRAPRALQTVKKSAAVPSAETPPLERCMSFDLPCIFGVVFFLSNLTF